MATKEKLQIGLEDVIVRDEELEKLLDDRQENKYAVAEFRKLDKQAKARIQSLETPPPFRIERYIVTKSSSPPRSVSFDVDGSTRITIKQIGEE